MEKKLQKIYLINYNLLITPNLLQAYYQMLSKIFLKEFIELNKYEHGNKKVRNLQNQI